MNDPKLASDPSSTSDWLCLIEWAIGVKLIQGGDWGGRDEGWQREALAYTRQIDEKLTVIELINKSRS